MQQFNDETTEKNSVGTMRRVLSKQQIQMLFHIHRSSAHLFNVISFCLSFAFRLRTVMTGCFVYKNQVNIIVASSSSPMIDYRSSDIHTPVNSSNHMTSTNDQHLLRPQSLKAIVSPRAQRVQRNTGMLITFLLFDAK